MEKRRFYYIDLIKTIAIFFVVFYHSTLFSSDFLSKATLRSYVLYFSKTILSTCSPLFFFVNGYLLFGNKFDLRKHIFKTIKIVFQAIIWAVITLLALQIIRGDHLSVIEFIEAIWNWKMDWINHLWYIGALVCIYVFFPVLKNVYDTNFKIMVYFTVICVLFTVGNATLNHALTVCASLFGENTGTFSGINFFNIYNPFRGIYGYTFAYFCVGGVICHYRNAIQGMDVKYRNIASGIVLFLSCLGLFALGCCYSNAEGSVWSVVWNGYDSIFTLINVICIYVLSLNWEKDCRIVREISSNTLGIYFIHWMVVSFLKPHIQKYDFMLNYPATFIFSLFVLLICLVICMIMRKSSVISELIR